MPKKYKKVMKPVRLVSMYAFLFVLVLVSYIGYSWKHHIPFKVGITGTVIGIIFGALLAFIQLIMSICLARKGVFILKLNLIGSNKKRFRILATILVTLIAFVFVVISGFFAANQYTSDFSWFREFWSLGLFLVCTLSAISALGYLFLELHYGKKFYAPMTMAEKNQ